METTFRLFLSVSATFLPECVSPMMRTVTPADTDTIADCKERHCCENKENRVLFLSWLKLHKKSLPCRNNNSFGGGECWGIWNHGHWAVESRWVTLPDCTRPVLLLRGRRNAHHVMRYDSQLRAQLGMKLVFRSLSPATRAEQSGLPAESRSRDSQAAQSACQGTPKCHIQLLTLSSVGGTGEWGVKCWVSTNVTAKVFKSHSNNRRRHYARRSDTKKTLSVPPPPAWRFIDIKLWCAINRGDTKRVWLSQGLSFTTWSMSFVSFTEILRHLSSSSLHLIKCSLEEGCDSREPSLHSMLLTAEIRCKYPLENLVYTIRA